MFISVYISWNLVSSYNFPQMKYSIFGVVTFCVLEKNALFRRFVKDGRSFTHLNVLFLVKFYRVK